MSELSGAFTLFPIPMSFFVPAVGQSFDLLGGQPGGAIAFDASGDQLQATPIKAGRSRYFYLKDTNSFSDACLMTFRAGAARRNRWERVAALSSAARVGSGGR
jgi:hypothetical protein